jgi:hypothetical protein
MNFLNPIVLLGFLAASIPFIIHFLSKRHPREVAFPSIRLLKLIQTDHLRLLRLKQLIILLLRTLIIIMVVTAFARPALKSFFKKNSPASAVIIIDNSASMQYVDNGEVLFKQALRKVEEIITMLPKEDSSAIIVAGTNPLLLGKGLTQDKRQLLNALSKVEGSWSKGNPTGAFDMAAKLLNSSGNVNKELYYISDGAFNSLPDSFMQSDAYLRLYPVLLGQEERDGSVIENITVLEKVLAVGRKMTFHVTSVVGGNDKDADIEFFVNGERKGKQVLTKRSDNRAEADFAYTPETDGWYSVYASVNSGYFELGEKRRIAVYIPPTIKVLAAGGTSDDLYFLENALEPDPEEHLFSVKKVTENELTQSDIASADVIILSGIKQLRDDLYQSLLSTVLEQGKGVLIFLPHNIQSSLYANGIFKDIILATIEKRMTYEGQNGKSHGAITWFDFSHPILKGISNSGDFQRPVVKSYVLLKPSASVRVLARFNDNSVAVGEATCGKGKAIVFTVGAFSYDSDLPLTGMFVPFFIRSVQYLSGKIIDSRHYESGEMISENISDFSQNTQVMVKHEDNPPVLIDIERSEKGVQVKGFVAEKPGFYSLYTGDEERFRTAVNVPAEEILFKRAPEEQYFHTFTNIKYKKIDGLKNTAEFVMNDRYGKEISGVFLMLALVLLCAEMVISKKV